jgi:mycofactocin glycosyltransferase
VIALPPGTRVVLDPAVRVSGAGRVLAGGSPWRVLRLSAAGPEALAELAAGRGTESQRRLGRRLVDAGMAHPQPPPAHPPPSVTLIIPVRDRAEELDRCLAAVRAPATPAALEVIVVDDGSADPAAIAGVCTRHGARLVRRAVSGGPAAARNAGFDVSQTELVAFLDSDCIPSPGWIGALAGHFADPLVGAAAPRVQPLTSNAYAQARSPLDMGARPAEVRPGGPVPYVPSAALVLRASAGGRFDPGLRYGEDVDLVWRLHDRGWRVRYDPRVHVRHREPPTYRGRLARRFRYGTSAAPLSRRHPGRLAPAVIHPVPGLAVALILARRPRAATAVLVAQAALLINKGVPPKTAARWSVEATAHTFLGAARAAGTLAAPALLRHHRAILAAPHLANWLREKPPVDPLRWTVLSLADDAAYGAGVHAGCLAHHTVEPLIPYHRRKSNHPNSEHSSP